MLPIYTSVVDLTTKQGAARDLTQAVNEEVRPILEKQTGFVDVTVHGAFFRGAAAWYGVWSQLGNSVNAMTADELEDIAHVGERIDAKASPSV